MICRFILSQGGGFFGSAQLALPRALLSYIPKPAESWGVGPVWRQALVLR